MIHTGDDTRLERDLDRQGWETRWGNVKGGAKRITDTLEMSVQRKDIKGD